MDHLEQLVLSGELFNGASRSSSPERTPSPSTSWPELSDEEDNHAPPPPNEDAGPPIGMGPGRTGVKGVIRDRDEAAARTRERRAQEAAALARAMEKASLGGKTYLEEERERQWAAGLSAPPTAFFGGERVGRFGHLREVGMKGYVSAVEEEDRRVWVVVHIYDPSLDRCDQLDDTLCRLARLHPETKFIRCRASAIGFATSSAKRPARRPSNSYLSRSRTIPGRYTDEDEDDPFGDDEKGAQEDEAEDEEDEDSVDTDMLPTMLVYRGGELVHNWVRVDWEAGNAGVEDLLERHNIIEPIRMGSTNLGLPPDDEDDISDREL